MYMYVDVFNAIFFSLQTLSFPTSSQWSTLRGLRRLTKVVDLDLLGR